VKANSENQHAKQLENEVCSLLNIGFWTAEEILEFVTDDSKLSRETCNSIVTRALEARKSEMLGWPAITDCEKLDTAFEQLDQTGIVARHCWHYSDIEGARSMSRYIEQCFPEAIGYVFYSREAMEHAIRFGSLKLIFLATDEWTWFDERPPTREFCTVRDAIAETLKRAALVVATTETTISIAMKWQRRNMPTRQLGRSVDFDPRSIRS
jgi:hypothetical protein